MVHENAIDAVVTWVDGADPAHLARRNEALRSLGLWDRCSLPAAAVESRFASSGELAYCLAAIRKFAPWIRTIHLVTDAQCPAFLDEDARLRLGVRLVDHRELFRGHEARLPVFNSRSIETMLHRIEGLSPRYLYFNDDVILMAPCSPEDFFADGKVVLRGWRRPLRLPGPTRLLASRLSNMVGTWVLGLNRSMPVLAQMRAAELAGLKSEFVQLAHVPHPVRKKTISDFFASHPEAMERNIAYRFRNMAQFVTAPLAAYLEMVHDNAVEAPGGDHELVCFNRDDPERIAGKLARAMDDPIKILCVQALDQAPPDLLGDVRNMIETRLAS